MSDAGHDPELCGQDHSEDEKMMQRRLQALAVVATGVAVAEHDEAGVGMPPPNTFAAEALLMGVILAAGAPEYFMEIVLAWRNGHATHGCDVTAEEHARELIVEITKLTRPDALEEETVAMHEHMARSAVARLASSMGMEFVRVDEEEST